MSDLFKNIIRKTCDKAVNINPYFLKIIPDDLKTKEMCNEAIEKASWLLYDVP